MFGYSPRDDLTAAFTFHGRAGGASFLRDTLAPSSLPFVAVEASQVNGLFWELVGEFCGILLLV